MSAGPASATFPGEAFRHHLAILGKTGSGKTTTAKGFAERLLDSGRRICAICPTGVWWGLRLLADGRTPGYPVVIFGGNHADIPLGDGSGARLAELIATETISCVIDTSIMTVGARTRFFTDFAEALFRANTKPLHLIIDEAHLFAPQGRVPDPQSGRMVHAANNLVSGGRARGLRIVLISQRPAKLHKDSLTQVETLIAMRLIAPQDRAAVEAWIGEWSDPKQGREVVASLPSLARGEGWVWAPELGVLARMPFPQIKTFDSSRTPEDGEPIETPNDLSAIDIESIRSALASPGHGKSGKGHERKPPTLRGDIAAAEKRGFERGFAEGIKHERRNSLTEAAAEVATLFDRLLSSRSAEASAAIPTPVQPPAPPKRADDRAFRAKGQPELRILRVLAARHPARFTKAQWATLSHMKRSGGTWQTYVSRLRTAGYIDERDGTVGLTPAGMAAAGEVDRALPGSVTEQWKAALGSGPARMIDILIEAYPRALDRANLADRVGMVATGGTFQTYLSRLRSNGLVEVAGRKITASPTLFIDSAHSDSPPSRMSLPR